MMMDVVVRNDDRYRCTDTCVIRACSSRLARGLNPVVVARVGRGAATREHTAPVVPIIPMRRMTSPPTIHISGLRSSDSAQYRALSMALARTWGCPSLFLSLFLRLFSLSLSFSRSPSFPLCAPIEARSDLGLFDDRDDQ